MSRIYREKKPIPIPEGAQCCNYDGRVFIQRGRRKEGDKVIKDRVVIGKVASDNLMFPNDMYKTLFPKLWEEHYGEISEKPFSLKFGFYAVVLLILHKIGLYTILLEVFGSTIANAIIDYSIYSILFKSNVIHTFKEKMYGNLIFSNKIYSDHWYSELFSSKMTLQDGYRFRNLWLNECSKNVRSVYLSIDGSNNDCKAQNSDLPEQGYAKSKNSCNIVSYIWVLDANTGTPITYSVYHGGTPDCKAINEITDRLKDLKIEISGIILDRNFATYDVVKTLENYNFPYIIMLKSNNYAHQEMIRQYGDEIIDNPKNFLNSSDIFGISDKKQLFQEYDNSSYVNLYYDPINGAERKISFLKNIRDEINNLNKLISEGKNVEVPAKYQKYIIIDEETNTVTFDDNCKDHVFKKGFFSIATSNDFGVDETNRLYKLRDASEKQYSTMKSQLGFNTTRVHSTESIHNRFLACFVSTIIRNEIKNICSEFGYDSNLTISKLNRAQMLLTFDGKYRVVHDFSELQKSIFSKLNITNLIISWIENDVNGRENEDINVGHERKIPETTINEQDIDSASDTPKRGRGRPKGSKNKSTLEKEARLAAQGIQVAPNVPESE